MTTLHGYPMMAKRLTLHELKVKYCRQVLKEEGGNRYRAAKVLGISPPTLYAMFPVDAEPRKGKKGGAA